MFRSTRLAFLVLILSALAAPLYSQTINCSSEDGKRHYCNVDTNQGVQMLNQRSASPCVQGSTWDFDRQGIWVDHGCRADFILTNVPLDLDHSIYCSSDDGKRHYCQIDAGGGVYLLRQRSGSPCTRGYSWDFDGHAVWTDRGCRADFAAALPPRAERHEIGNDRGEDQRDRKTIYCASDDGRRNYCPAEIRRGAELVRQVSGSPCTKGYSWDYSGDGIWVDHGCRADFAVAIGWDHKHERDDDGDDHNSRSCLRTIGPERVNVLVDQCQQVSTGTHPPCNAENSCSLINDEIRRGCSLLGRDAPSFCDRYR